MLSQGLTVLFSVIVICHGADMLWQVKLKTSDIENAGTNAGIFIQIMGPKIRSTTIELDSPGDDFERNNEEIFVVKLPDVGRPTGLRVYSDNQAASPDWHLRWIEMEAVNGEYPGTFVFNCGCWMSEHYGLDRILPLSTTGWRVKVKTSNLGSAGSNTHVWIKIVGDKGTTQNIELDNVGEDIERGTTDVYNIQTADVGIVKELDVRTGDDDNWHLEKIVLEKLNGAGTYTFTCNCWLGEKEKTAAFLSLS